MTFIIGFAGKAGAGKDTAATSFLDAFYYFEKTTPLHSMVGFATPLKDMLALYLRYRGVTRQDIHTMLYGTLAQKKAAHAAWGGKDSRNVMQTLGTEWGRIMVYDHMWVDAWRDRSRIVRHEGKCVLTCDVRFPNEVDMVRAEGGVVVRIVRPSQEASGDTHTSETHNLDVDYEVINDGRVHELGKKVYTAVAERLKL